VITNRNAAFTVKPTAASHCSGSLRPPSIAAPSQIAARIHNSLLRIVQRLAKPFMQHRRRRRLELLEIQQLGEKRFVAIVRVGRQKFLISGAASVVTLLAEISPRKTTLMSPRPLNQESA